MAKDEVTKNAAPAAATPERLDERLARPNREDAHRDDRGGDNREFTNRDWERENQPTDPERRRKFREKWMANHLPNLPKKDGWHRCWVSESHALDTPQRRLGLGYRFVKEDDLKTEGWAMNSVKDARAVDGVVRVREMCAMECTQEDYITLMREFHHDQPRDMARDIYGGLEQTASEVRDRGGKVELGDGFQEMARFRRAPTQFEG